MKNYYDVRAWVETVIDSCINIDHVIACDKLLEHFYEMYCRGVSLKYPIQRVRYGDLLNLRAKTLMKKEFYLNIKK